MTRPALVGRRVVVTRAAEQAGALERLLRECGAEPVVVPLLAIQPVPEAADQLAALDPCAFDWLVVTSPNGAAAYLRAHNARSPRQVAAVGSATAAALEAGGVAPTLVPTVQRAAGLLAEFPAAGTSGSAGSTTILLVQAVDAEPLLADGLAAAGHSVTSIAPYRSVPALPTAAQQLAALRADALLLASGSAARAWAAVFGAAGPPIVVAIGPQTAAAAEVAGLKITAIAADHSLPGLVTALEDRFAAAD